MSRDTELLEKWLSSVHFDKPSYGVPVLEPEPSDPDDESTHPRLVSKRIARGQDSPYDADKELEFSHGWKPVRGAGKLGRDKGKDEHSRTSTGEKEYEAGTAIERTHEFPGQWIAVQGGARVRQTHDGRFHVHRRGQGISEYERIREVQNDLYPERRRGQQEESLEDIFGDLDDIAGGRAPHPRREEEKFKLKEPTPERMKVHERRVREQEEARKPEPEPEERPNNPLPNSPYEATNLARERPNQWIPAARGIEVGYNPETGEYTIRNNKGDELKSDNKREAEHIMANVISAGSVEPGSEPGTADVLSLVDNEWMEDDTFRELANRLNSLEDMGELDDLEGEFGTSEWDNLEITRNDQFNDETGLYEPRFDLRRQDSQEDLLNEADVNELIQNLRSIEDDGGLVGRYSPGDEFSVGDLWSDDYGSEDRLKMAKEIWDHDDPQTGLQSEVTEINARSYGARVRGVVRDSNGLTVGEFERNISESSVTHEYFKLDADVQGGGFATRFNEQAYDYYRSLGLSEVRVHANIDIGGFTWARQGFDASSSVKESFLREFIREHRLDTEEIADPVNIDTVKMLDQAQDLLDMLEGGDSSAVTMYDISRLGFTKDHAMRKDAGDKRVMWPGKEFLLGSDWYGVKEL